MKIFLYSLLLFFCLGGVIAEYANEFKSFKLIDYRYNFSKNDYFIKDKLYYTNKLPTYNSEGSEGNWIYYGKIKSSGKEGSISGWIKNLESKWYFDEIRQQYYFNIWYCPELNVIAQVIEGDINGPKNKSFRESMLQSWFRVIMFCLSLPLTIVVFRLVKSKKQNKKNFC